MDELVKQFVALHTQTEELLNKGELAQAKQKYLEILETYQQISKSQLEKFHKELAYDQVTTLHTKVNEAKSRIDIPYHILAAAVLIVAFSILIFLKPSIVGLAGLDDLVRQQVNITFTASGLHELTLRDRPLSLAASGSFTGNVKLYYKQGQKLELIFDSKNATEGNFSDICEETCQITTNSNIIELFAVIESGTLQIDSIIYHIEHKNNAPPTWKGTLRNFKAKVGQQTIIDLADYFEDQDNDSLVFLSTTDEGMDIIVQNSKVAIKPSTIGTKNIIFIASDQIAVTRVPVTIEVNS